MTAFFDDSGEPEPNSGRNFFALGMIVLPSKSIRPCTKAWQTRIWQRVGISPQVLARIKVEIKSSELYNLQDRLMKGNALKPEQQILYSLGLNTRQRVTNFINEIWDFVEKPPVPIKYLGSVVNKGINWNNYSGMKYQEWRLF